MVVKLFQGILELFTNKQLLIVQLNPTRCVILRKEGLRDDDKGQQISYQRTINNNN